MSFNVDDYYNKLTDSDALVAFKGIVNSGVINNMLDTVEKKLEENEDTAKFAKKVYHIIVEGMQNLFHHIEDLTDELVEKHGHKFGILIVKKIDDGFMVIFGNFVNQKQKEALAEKIDKINSLSVDELKEMYKFILNHQKLSAKGGGGLGLIDMAKKTKNPLHYQFFEYNEQCYFYELSLTIN